MLNEGQVGNQPDPEQIQKIMEFEQMKAQYPYEVFFDEEQQKIAANIVLKDFETSETARQQKHPVSGMSWEDKIQEIAESWEGIRKPKVKPFKGCSNKTMRLTTSIEQTMHSQALAAIWKDGEITFRPGEKTDAYHIRRTNEFMTWVVQNDIEGYDLLDDYTHSCTKFGTGIFKYAWDIKEEYLPQKAPTMGGFMVVGSVPVIKPGVTVIVVPVDAIYVQPGATTFQGPQPVIHRMSYTYQEVEEAMNRGIYLNRLENIRENVHSNLDTSKIGPIDKVNESADKKALYVSTMRTQSLDILEWYGLMDVGDPRGPQECIIWVEKNSKTFLSAKLLRSLYPRNRRPFIGRPCIKRGSNLLGIGYVELSKPLADEVDALYNQSNDANTLDIMPGGFYAPTSGMDPDKVELGPNVWLPVENPIQNVYMPVRNHNTEKFVMMIRNVLEFVERLTAASSYLMGKESELIGGTGSATRTNQIVAHGEMRLGPILHRIAAGWYELLTEIYYLYYFFAPPGYPERIIGEDGGQLFPNMVLQESFLNNADAYGTPDVAMVTREFRRQLAMWVYEQFSMHPLVLQDPARLWQVAYEVLDAMGHNNPEQIIGPQPGSNADMTLINLENTRLMQGELVPVNPTDIDIQHIQGHTMMLQGRQLPDELKQIIATHIAMHQQKLQTVMEGVLGTKEKNGKPEATKK